MDVGTRGSILYPNKKVSPNFFSRYGHEKSPEKNSVFHNAMELHSTSDRESKEINVSLNIYYLLTSLVPIPVRPSSHFQK